MFARKKPAAVPVETPAADTPSAPAAAETVAPAPEGEPKAPPKPDAKPEAKAEPKPEPARAARPAPSAARPKTASLLTGDLTFVGTLTSEGEVHLDGAFEGDVRAPVVTVGAGGRVDGVLTARRIEVHGQVKGGLAADEVRVRMKAQVEGEVTSDSFALEAGARFEGLSRRKAG